jgi:hypothetical protein
MIMKANLMRAFYLKPWEVDNLSIRFTKVLLMLLSEEATKNG